MIVAAGVLGVWLKKGSEPSTQNTEVSNSSHTSEWNPYANESHHKITLSDQLISAGGGEYVIKMSVTLDLASDEAYYKYMGYKDTKEAEKAEKAEGGGHGPEDGVVTPMELKINDTIGDLMMNANGEQLTDREMLKGYLKDGINKALNFDKPIVKEMYIENFIIQ